MPQPKTITVTSCHDCVFQELDEQWHFHRVCKLSPDVTDGQIEDSVSSALTKIYKTDPEPTPVLPGNCPLRVMNVVIEGAVVTSGNEQGYE
jgi:hypothetical protein